MTCSDTRKALIGSIVGLIALTSLAPITSRAETTPFIAPPRTISDITAILDSEKPNPAAIAKWRLRADQAPPSDASRATLAEFLYQRAIARVQLGRDQDSLLDAEKAVELKREAPELRDLIKFEQLASLMNGRTGRKIRAREILDAMAQEYDRPETRARLANIYRLIIEKCLEIGELDQADIYLAKQQSVVSRLRASESYGGYMRANVESNSQAGLGEVLERRGRLKEAEAAFQNAEAWMREALDIGLDSQAPAREQLEQTANNFLSELGRVKALQGRTAEGESDVRRALLNALKLNGKYNLQTLKIVSVLANLLIDQGRFGEAEQLARIQLQVDRELGWSEYTQFHTNALGQLASVLSLQYRWNEAALTYAELERATRTWEPERREELMLTSSRILTYYNSGNLSGGLQAAQRLIELQSRRYGKDHLQTAVARGLVGIGLALAGKTDDAVAEFRLAIPVMEKFSAVSDEEDALAKAVGEQRAQEIAAAYLALLSRNAQGGRDDEASEEGFRLSDLLRGGSVRKAIAASSVRMAAKDAFLADLVRTEQDLTKQINAQFGALNNLLAMPSDERNDDAVRSIRAKIDDARGRRDQARSEIGRRFPEYAELTEPKAPTVREVRRVLREDEVLLSFYFGRDHSYVWAVPKDGPMRFSPVDASAAKIEEIVAGLREALEPQATTIADIPSFDLAQAHRLYELLLKPVEKAWKPAKSLIVVTNGALGSLPLSLLPTAPVEVTRDKKIPFSEYRDVPWLVRSHAVTMIPSVATLLSLRQLPAGSRRVAQMIGFGDPIFSKAQAGEAEPAASGRPSRTAAVTTLGLPLRRRASPRLEGIDSADLARLPRLPDTAEELKSIALALDDDASKVLNLGIAANEQTVKSTDFFKFNVVVFATHGLVPGELNGLDQPALAMTAPDVAGVPGDGLLTMEEILALKMNADWVVLSACNTGAAAGAGAEAASGLGRAFFYAGTRAILVTNWSVHSESARDLVTDLFRRQAGDPKISRGQALRQAMMDMIADGGFADATGHTLFSYAHPLFWAPYSIIGDGGAN